MIPHYRDHAANERTYLAWVRTGITVMMLGVLLERFDLFLSLIAYQQAGHTIPPRMAYAGELSFSLVALGIVMICAATVRYLLVRRALEGEQALAFRGLGLMLFVSLSMVVFGISLLFYFYRFA